MQTGRPRAFDIDQALDRALLVFWQKGYEGASLPDLTAAMGINKPSLYAAFGNKEALFRKALDRYAETSAGYLDAAFDEPNARAAIEHLLRNTAEALSDPETPSGCLMVQGALTCGDSAEGIKRELACRRAASQAAICARLERAKQEGDLPAEMEAADLARYVTTLMQGLAVQAAGGASRDELMAVVTLALEVWPKAKSS